MSSTALGRSAIRVRPMLESDLDEVDKIFRVSFGTFIGLPNPEDFAKGQDFVRTRWRTNPESTFCADYEGALAGSNFAMRWGSFAFFGPLTTRPALWNKGIAQPLLAATVDLFDHWGVTHAGLFTFPHSTKHVHLYQKFGFWPRFLTALMSKPVEGAKAVRHISFADADESERSQILDGCRALSDSIYDGLDLTAEILAVDKQKLGETVVLWDSDAVDGFAVCHCGEGTEGGPGKCYVKFGAARDEKALERLLGACETMAAKKGLQTIDAGVNLARGGAYRTMLRHGFRSRAQGVAMERPDEPGFNRPDAFVIDDWR